MSIHQLDPPRDKPPPARILVVDSDEQDLRLAVRMLEPLSSRYALVPAHTAQSWYAATQHEGISAVVCADQLAFGDGVSVLQTMRLLYPECVTVLFGTSDALQARTALASGAVDEVLAKNAQGWVSLLQLLSGHLSGVHAHDEMPHDEAGPEGARALRDAVPATPGTQSSPEAERPAEASHTADEVTPSCTPPTARAWATSAAAVSHDMRDWVQLIGHRATALGGHDSLQGDTQAQHHLRRIMENVVRLQDVLDEVFSPAGDEDADKATVSLDAVVAEIADQLCLAEPDARVEIDFRDLPEVNGQRTALYRLFDNLIRNAIRHAEHSPVRIRLRATRSADAHLICVSDNGPGIPTERLEQVFEPHFRGPGAESKPGAGIGLTTCREIVKSLGGAIWIESPSRRGVTVFIRLPVRAQGRYAEVES